MNYQHIKQRLDAKDIIVLDGGTGTELQRRGAQMDTAAWCGPASLTNSALLTEIHLDYINAGADVITANTYASSRLMLTGAGFGERVEEINTIAVEAALRARDLAPAGRKVVVAGSLSHMVPVAQGTAVVDQAKTPPLNQISDAFHELAQVLKKAGVDHIMLEMMYEPTRVPLVLEAALLGTSDCKNENISRSESQSHVSAGQLAIGKSNTLRCINMLNSEPTASTKYLCTK